MFSYCLIKEAKQLWTSVHKWRLGCQLYVSAVLCHQKDFLALISVTGCGNPRAIVQLEGLGKLKEFNQLIGTRNRDLPACSIAPQPSTLPRAPENVINDWETEQEYSSVQSKAKDVCSSIPLIFSLCRMAFQLSGRKPVCQSQLSKFRIVKTGIKGNVWLRTREHFTDESIRTDLGSCLVTHFGLSSVAASDLI
jgi:hypothetical protein